MEPQPYDMSKPADRARWYHEMKGYLSLAGEDNFLTQGTDRPGRKYAWEAFISIEREFADNEIVVRLLCNVRGNPIIAPPGTIQREGNEVIANSNPYGAISAVCENGERLGLYPNEFEFIKAPEWVLRIWVQHSGPSGDSALALLKGGKS